MLFSAFFQVYFKEMPRAKVARPAVQVPEDDLVHSDLGR